MKYNSRNEIILVARKLPDCENLGIGYLLASLQSAGFQGDMEILNDLRDMNRICKRILIEKPYLVLRSVNPSKKSFP